MQPDPEFTVEHRGYTARFYPNGDNYDMEVVNGNGEPVIAVGSIMQTAAKTAEFVGQSMIDGILTEYRDESVDQTTHNTDEGIS